MADRTLTNPPTEAIGINHVGILLGVSVSTVRRMVRDGKLAAWMVRGQLRFRRDDVDAVATEVVPVGGPKHERQPRALSPEAELAYRVFSRKAKQ